MCVADGRNASHQSVGGQHGQIFADAVAAAEVNLHGAPPVGRVAHDDVGKFELPRRLPLPAKKRAELVVFLRHRGGLRGLNAKLLVVVAKRFQLAEQFAPRQGSVGGGDWQLLGGAGQAEQRQKPAPDGEFQRGGGARRQAEEQQCCQRHCAERDVMFLL